MQSKNNYYLFWEIVNKRTFKISLRVCKDNFIEFIGSFKAFEEIGISLYNLILSVVEIFALPILKIIARYKLTNK